MTQDPTIFATQKQLAWSAWQAAFDAGAGTLLPDFAKFESWWTDVALKVSWKDLHELMQAAWGSGVQDRNQQCTAGFNAWWQGVLADQESKT